jgi:hypothetical protein
MDHHCHTYLRAIFAETVELDFLDKDPTRKLKRPKTRKPDETRLEWAQYQRDQAITVIMMPTFPPPHTIFRAIAHVLHPRPKPQAESAQKSLR